MTKHGFIDLETFVDKIYEAAAMPEGWVDVLDSISNISGAVGSTIFTVNPSNNIWWLSTPGIADLMKSFVSEGWLSRNSRGERTTRIGGARFISELDLYDRDEIATDPMHRDFLIPRGFGWGTGTRIPAPTGDTIVFSSDRRWVDGPIPQSSVDLLTSLRPHLARSALLSVSIGFQQAQSTVKALERIGLPAAVMRPGRQIMARNVHFDELDYLVGLGMRDRLDILDSRAQATFVTAMHAIENRAASDVMSIPVRGVKDHEAPRIVHVIPITRSARDVFVGATAIIFVTPTKATFGLRQDWLAALFDLTPMEAQVCQMIADGSSLIDVSLQLGSTKETARKHLAKVFNKTGTNKQSELCLMMSYLRL